MFPERLRCLWISRWLPYPLDAGAKVYSAKLAESLAASGASVRFLGFGDPAVAPVVSGLDWIGVPGGRRHQLAALANRLPLTAATDSTRQYASLLDQELAADWDALVIDSYGAGWALMRCLAYRDRWQGIPVVAHVSHNHEEALWRSLVRETQGSLVKRLALWQNYRKVAHLERRLAAGADVVTAITDEDAAALRRISRGADVLTLTPGHAGWVATQRTITPATPRRVAIVGSFHWVVKQENLRRFLEVADPVFARAGIVLDIAGDVPEGLRAQLESRCRATRFHGFVSDVAPLLADTRLAIVPELIGGGFKLKFLDYIFARVPVATLSQAAAGLPPPLRAAMLSCEDLPSLVAGIVAQIDDVALLDRMQQSAFDRAESLFRWSDRGAHLKHALVGRRREHLRALGVTGRAARTFSARATSR